MAAAATAAPDPEMASDYVVGDIGALLGGDCGAARSNDDLAAAMVRAKAIEANLLKKLNPAAPALQVSDKKADQSKSLKNKPRDSKEDLARTLFVGNVPLEMKQRELIRHLGLSEQPGSVDSIRFRSLPVDPRYRRNRTFAAAAQRFTDASLVKSLVAKSGLRLPTGERLRLTPVSFKREESTRSTVFVGNLSLKTTESMLWDLFEEKLNTKVFNVRIIRDSIEYTSKGYGFVQLSKKEDVKLAIQKLHKFDLNGKPMNVTQVETPDPDLERRQLKKLKKKHSTFLMKQTDNHPAAKRLAKREAEKGKMQSSHKDFLRRLPFKGGKKITKKVIQKKSNPSKLKKKKTLI